MQTNSTHKWLIAILLVGFVLRMMALSYTDLETLRFSGGDEFWYLVNGLGLFQAETSGLALGYPYAAHNLPIAPIYLIITGLFQQIFPINTAIIMIRVFQMLLSVLTCYFVYDIGRLLSQDERVGLVGASALAFGK